jgi:hypothetical protein
MDESWKLIEKSQSQKVAYGIARIGKFIDRNLVDDLAHAWNPSYLGGRDQMDHGLKPARANSSMRPYLKNPFTKIGLVE